MKRILLLFLSFLILLLTLFALSSCGECKEHAFGEPIVDRKATETDAGEQHRICAKCGTTTVEEIPKLTHRHTYDDAWTSDDTYHWHASACGHVTEISDRAEHTFGDWITDSEPTEETVGKKHRFCTVCEKRENGEIPKLSHTHRYDAAWSHDDTYHWHASACGHVTEIDGKAAHTYENGVCTVCGAEESELPVNPHTHTYDDAWSSDDTYHWHASTCGHVTEVAGKEAHDFGDWITDLDATEETVGKKHRFCQTCRKREDGDLPKLPHTHKYDEKWSYDDTCHWHASTCGHTTEVSEKANHTFQNGVCTVCKIGALPSDEELIYRLSEDKKSYVVVGIGKSVGGDVVIPATHYGLPVREIGKEAFYQCKTVTGVTVPASVEVIGVNAFQLASSLRTVTFEKGSRCARIEKGAFGACASLKEFPLPKSVTLIGDGAFFACSSLTKLHITDLAAWCAIDFGMYANPLTFAHSLYIDGELADVISVPVGVTKISARAFEGCTSVTTVTIPESVTKIGISAFKGCSELRELTIRAGIAAMEDEVFADCQSLSLLILPEHITKIGRSSFKNCKNLTSVTIPAQMTGIGSSAFQGCYKLIEVINHSSLTIVAGAAKYGYAGYYAKYVTQSEENSRLTVDKDGYLFYEEENAAYLMGYRGTDNVLTLPATSPSGMSYEIYRYAFYRSRAVTSVTIPAGIPGIPDHAFSYCKNLTDVKIPASVREVGASAFGYDFYLRRVTFEENSECRSIGESAFYACSRLTGIAIPSRVTDIGNSALARCAALTTVVLPDGVTAIGDLTFEGCTGLTEITIPENVTVIGSSAVSRCASLTDIYYAGTEDEWLAVAKTDGWDDGAGTYTVHYGS